MCYLALLRLLPGCVLEAGGRDREKPIELQELLQTVLMETSLGREWSEAEGLSLYSSPTLHMIPNTKIKNKTKNCQLFLG